MLPQDSPVRVCAITCDCYPDDPLVRRTAEAAISAGYEYHVVCSMRTGQLRYELCNGVHVHRIAIPRIDGSPVGRISGKPLSITVVLWSIFTLFALVRIAILRAKFRFNVVHAHNMPDFLVLAGMIPKIFGARIILHIQDVSPELTASRTTGVIRKIACSLARIQEQLSLDLADHVLTIGWTLEELLLKRGVPREKMSSILNSADPEIFRPEKRTKLFLGEPSAERPLILLYHGTCASRTGLDTVIAAIAKARSVAPYVQLRIMGTGEALSSLKELVRGLALSDAVTFLTVGPVDAVVEFIAQGDVGIIPYPSDGFMDLVLPTKAYEFALMGRPMIASDLAGIRSLFRSSSILFCEPSNADSFAGAIVELYRSPARRAALAKSAAQDNLKYRWELMADRYRQLLLALTSGTEPRYAGTFGQTIESAQRCAETKEER